jgi:hypothetical protein
VCLLTTSATAKDYLNIRNFLKKRSTNSRSLVVNLEVYLCRHVGECSKLMGQGLNYHKEEWGVIFTWKLDVMNKYEKGKHLVILLCKLRYWGQFSNDDDW